MSENLYRLNKDIRDDKDLCISDNLKLNLHNNNITKIDHRDTCPIIYKQGSLGSCTANALCCIFYHNLIKFNYSEVFEPSRLFLYYNTRAMKSMVEIDDGGSFREALKALHKYGMCPEKMWEYDISQFKVKPPPCTYQFGQKHNYIKYFHVPQLISQLRQCLIDGYLFAFGLVVYSNFESDIVRKKGLVSLPTEYDVYLGGHAVCAVGYDDSKQVFIVRNSWGQDWGDKGYFYLPYQYMINTDLVYDIWTFRNGPENVPLTDDNPSEMNKALINHPNDENICCCCNIV